MQHNHPGGPLTLDKKWQQLIDGECEELPELSPKELQNGIAVLLRRISKYEEDAKADRGRFMQLHTEHLNLKAKVKDMDDAWRKSVDNMAKLPDVPSYIDVMAAAAAEPRNMTQWELWNMHHELSKVKDGGRDAQEITRIMDVQPVNGHVHWNFAGLSPRIQWQVFYYIMFHGVKKKRTLTARTAQTQKEIDAAGPVTSASFEGLSLRGEDDLEGSFCEDDEEACSLG